MIYGIPEGSDGALVGSENGQDNGCAKGNAEEGQEGRSPVLPEVGERVGKNPGRKLHRGTDSLWSIPDSSGWPWRMMPSRI